SFQTRINILFVAAVASLKACRDLSEAFAVLTQFIEDALRLAATEMIEFTGPHKRGAVLAWVGQLYDLTAAFVPLPWFLQPLRWVFGKQVVLLIAGGILEGIYARHKDSINDG